MTEWSPTEIAVVMGGTAAMISAIGTNVVQLVIAFRTHRAVEVVAKSVNGMLAARDVASVARGDLEGRQNLHAEQAAGALVKKEEVRHEAEADAQSAANVRAIEAGAAASGLPALPSSPLPVADEKTAAAVERVVEAIQNGTSALSKKV